VSGRTEVPKEKPEADAIFARAAARARKMALPYAGAVTPQEAYELQRGGEAQIVDVRTPPEWQFVGHVPNAPLVEWPREGGREKIEQFVREFRERFEPSDKLLLLCRSGVRSHYAAELLAQAGFQNAYNVLEGFEGEHGLGRNGWRAAGLPWKKG
jgi:rhodanese-related sulfurtransferase